ncbi:1-phosphofructokinase family hexose kinase [Sphingobacterium olei]|uniref:1-phosphofructokinase family hexose kinase n=1 Tax=Sphingobacterium olei TaxID=2571155 RepID=A0A4U0P1G3_9SPHI|nr:1-phosphofructokinase family hexose kinase [Sphingobacterium olei]TJZ61101.1 1-phosphofructokinase family hexose kinase [Sphingobacterium olei]
MNNLTNIKKVLTITINPCVDKSSSVSGIVPEKKLRCQLPKYEPGGGGINVSRALKRLKAESLTLFTSGGRTGKLLEELLRKENLDIFPFTVEHETRENFIVTDSLNEQQFRFGFPGMPISEREQIAFLNTIQKIEDFPEISVISGSLPDGVDPYFIKEVIQVCKHKNSKVIMDTSGKSLEIAAEEGVFLLKPNIGELSALTGNSELSNSMLDVAAAQLIKKGSAKVVVVSSGASGATLFYDTKKIYQPAPLVKVRSTVGAGDSMVAGMVSVLAINGSMEEMLRMGVACGSATTMAEGTGLFQTENVNKLLMAL